MPFSGGAFDMLLLSGSSGANLRELLRNSAMCLLPIPLYIETCLAVLGKRCSGIEHHGNMNGSR